MTFFCFLTIIKKNCAGIVQLVEHLLAKEDVARSSRVTRYFRYKSYWSREFNSKIVKHNELFSIFINFITHGSFDPLSHNNLVLLLPMAEADSAEGRIELATQLTNYQI